ncbi:pectate lyase-domain-containing protein [Mucidula mucida]|nr:pectate lyase-domain-containing protein [Mucidula mucida]
MAAGRSTIVEAALAKANRRETGRIPVKHLFTLQVFYLHEGATLQNVIIGANQAEGVHCTGYCTLNFVWKNDGAGDYSNIIGGGAYHAEDKVVQHNGCGTIINFYVEATLPDYGKLYRSCGNCSSQCKRNVYISGVDARDGGTSPVSTTTTLCEPKVIGYCSG